MQEEEGRWEFGWGVLPAGGCPLVHLSVLGMLWPCGQCQPCLEGLNSGSCWLCHDKCGHLACQGHRDWVWGSGSLPGLC